MSLSPSSILTKLDELKKWQNKQQERLLEQHHKLIEDSDVPPTKSVPKIKPKDNAKPKQPYLRRGSGLSRFRMSPGEQFKPFHHDKKIKPKTPRRKIEFNKEIVQPSPLQKPTVALPKAVWENAGLNETDRELVIFEKLEQRAMNNSFCSTNSSIVRLLSSSTPHKDSPKKNQIEAVYTTHNTNFETQNDTKTNDYEKKIQNDYLNLIVKAMEFKNYMNTDLTPSTSVASMNTLQNGSYNDNNKWTDFDAESTQSSVSSLCSEKVVDEECVDHEECEEVEIIKCDAETMTDSYEDEKVHALEQELKDVRLDNTKHKQKLKEFEKYKQEATKLLEEEKNRVSATLEEERKKLAKDKMVFERYVKDLQNKPSRKERDEISVLKTEIATLKETLKLKETRHGTTQARLRNQIKSLEKDNANLKIEIDNLNKQHAKLVVHQKLNVKPSNTKILHEINKNLSKLSRERLRKSVETVESSSEDDKDSEENNKNVSKTKAENPYKRLSDGFCEEIAKVKDRTEQILSDGTKQIKYSNGNIKNISSDGNIIIFQYFNGDVKETNLLEGTICYHYAETKVNHTTYADGSELIQFPDGQIERRYKTGACEVDYPNNMKRKIHADGTEDIFYPDGTIVNIQDDKRTITLPNGQKEVHTEDYKRREYPDGTVKTVYPDGTQETRYVNGRVRLKDKYGKLIMDSQQ
ncbi:hypothetical protein RN001_011025 [Aquatica leii]|uniref:Centromere protein J C-terminal domain-containing protein n=1 Tax=Aquatica leii TaxID=1421715 RepID=A0AAN7SGF2_9COLE|nr:hypothetical protein RN001_011025 [Aquatica leii]